MYGHMVPFGSGFKCHYCNIAFRGGGATRFKEHLVGIIGNVRKCLEESRAEGKRTRVENKARNRDENDRKRSIGDQITFIFTFFS
jgi:hypothetical protein